MTSAFSPGRLLKPLAALLLSVLLPACSESSDPPIQSDTSVDATINDVSVDNGLMLPHLKARVIPTSSPTGRE